MITIISGPQGSGKTTKAKEMTIGKNALWMKEKDIKYEFWASRKVTIDTEIIVVEEVTSKDTIDSFIYNHTLKLDIQGFPIQEIKCPELIFVSQYINYKAFHERHKITGIICPINDQQNRALAPIMYGIEDIKVKAEFLFELANKQQWINRTPQCLPEKTRNGEQWVWVDKNGNVFECGADFSAAEKAETYPCKVYRLQSVSVAVNT